MDHKQHRPTPGAGRLPQTQKLKDTCDMCSASKVKCDKQRPICGRCGRLGYPCFFSPARRIRKRRCVQRLSSNTRDRDTERPSEAQSITASRDASVAAASDASEDTAESSSRDVANGPSTTEFEGICSSTLFDDSNGAVLPYTSNDEYDSSGRMVLGSKVSSDGASSPPERSHSDCAALAIDLLQELNMTAGARSFATPRLSGGDTGILDARFEVASTAIKHSSTILICPCSRRMEVGLLAAAVCTALLDTYEVILRYSKKPSIVSAPTGKAQNMNKGSVKGLTGQEHGNSDGDPNRETNEAAAAMRLLEELPKVANLVTQFTKRYGQNAESSSKDLHQVLAASLTASLKSIINEVTDRVAQI
ncbi:hypothetical protein G7Y79_00010g028760 [Physcia stellaris]|nr:hypothetical protein G7Y79_00010g028760 [Physcia stellaris]